MGPDHAEDDDGERRDAVEGEARDAVVDGEVGGPGVEDVRDDAVGAVETEEAVDVGSEGVDGGEEIGGEVGGGEEGDVGGGGGGEGKGEEVDGREGVGDGGGDEGSIGVGSDDGGSDAGTGGEELGEVDHGDHVAGGQEGEEEDVEFLLHEFRLVRKFTCMLKDKCRGCYLFKLLKVNFTKSS